MGEEIPRKADELSVCLLKKNSSEKMLEAEHNACNEPR
jgi:hypothetical protein